MNRILVVVVILQFLVILGLGLAYFGKSGDRELSPAQESEEGQRNDGAEFEARRLQGRSSTKTDLTQPSDSAGKSKEGDGDPSAAVTSVVVYGSVRNESGEALEGKLRFFVAGKNSNYSMFADGQYSQAGLTPGLWKYEFRVEGHRPLSGDIELGETETRRLDIQVIKAVVLRVRVLTPEGEPISTKTNGRSLSVIATEGPVNSDFPLTPYRSLDRFGLGEFQGGMRQRYNEVNLADEFIGKIELSGALPVHLSLVLRHLVLQTVLVPVGTEVVDFVVTESELAGLSSSFRVKLIDSLSSEAIRAVRIDLSDVQTSGSRPMTSEDGVYSLEGVMPGLMDLTISAAGCGIIRRTLNFKRSELLDLGTWKLYPAASIKGRILDQDGKGRVAWIGARSFEALKFLQDTTSSYGYSSDEKGEFELKGLEQGRYLLRFIDQERKQILQEVLELRGGETVLKDFHFGASSTLEIHSKLAPEELLFARLVDSAGLPIWEAHCHPGPAWSRTFQVVPGHYRWEVYRDQELQRSEDLDIGGAKTEVSVP